MKVSEAARCDEALREGIELELYKHQREGLESTQGMNHVAYYWDMGLGKTYVGSEKMLELGERVNLVVCQKSKVEDWLEHFKTNYHDEGFVYLNLTKQMDIRYFTYSAAQEFATVGLVGVINYDLVWRRKELVNLEGFTLLLDESSMIQNENAKRTKFILKMKPENVILLSGTPTGGKYERLWSQLHLLGWPISKKMYWNQYVRTRTLETMGGASIKVVDGYKNVPRLKRKMREHGCSFLKTDEVMDLPAQTFQKIRVDATPEYRHFHRTGLVEVDGRELVGDTTLTKMLYERQLCGIYSKEKLQAFQDLLESTEERLVVFYNFQEEYERLRKVCESLDRPISTVNGKQRALSAYEAESNSVTLVQYQAGAMGLNLQLANRVIYFTLPLSSELFEQSKKRIHRIGQEKPCFYYVMLCRNSIEQRILKALEQRRDYTEELFRKEVNR